jgi:hypothetical protein
MKYRVVARRTTNGERIVVRDNLTQEDADGYVTLLNRYGAPGWENAIEADRLAALLPRAGWTVLDDAPTPRAAGDKGNSKTST